MYVSGYGAPSEIQYVGEHARLRLEGCGVCFFLVRWNRSPGTFLSTLTVRSVCDEWNPHVEKIGARGREIVDLRNHMPHTGERAAVARSGLAGRCAML